MQTPDTTMSAKLSRMPQISFRTQRHRGYQGQPSKYSVVENSRKISISLQNYLEKKTNNLKLSTLPAREKLSLDLLPDEAARNGHCVRM